MISPLYTESTNKLYFLQKLEHIDLKINVLTILMVIQLSGFLKSCVIRVLNARYIHNNTHHRSVRRGYRLRLEHLH